MYYIYHSSPRDVRVTIAGKKENGVLELSAARCSSKDNFSRSIGRNIALGRLNKGKVFKTIENFDGNNSDFIDIAQREANEIIQTASKINV